MSAGHTPTIETLTETVELLTLTSKVFASSIQNLDEVLEREAAGEIDAGTALATMRAIMERHYGEGGTAH